MGPLVDGFTWPDNSGEPRCPGTCGDFHARAGGPVGRSEEGSPGKASRRGWFGLEERRPKGEQGAQAELSLSDVLTGGAQGEGLDTMSELQRSPG